MNRFLNWLSRQSRGSVVAMNAGLSAVLTAAILLALLVYSGTPRKIVTMGTDMGTVNRFRISTSNAVSDALEGIASIEKKYWISRDAAAAPKPNPDLFGQTEDPGELGWLAEEGADLLSGQKLFFSPDMDFLPGYPVRYYLDETILAITWKQYIDHTVYTFSEVKIADPSQFRRFLAGGEYGSGKLIITTEMADSVNAVVASSGDFYQFRNAGIIVYDGIARRAANGLADTCYIDYDGNMHFTRADEYLDVPMAQKYVDENNIQFSLAFGPVLVEDGARCYWGTDYSLGEVEFDFARAALCQMDDLHYLLVTANDEPGFPGLTTMQRFTNVICSTGCRMAYALDGGQTAVIAMNGELINNVTYGYQRKISDIIYFGTAIPSGQD